MNSLSKSDTLRKVGLVPIGGNYKTLDKYIKKYNINTEHFTGRAWNVGERYNPINPKRPLSEILVEYSTFSTSHLKVRILDEGIKKRKCEKCKLTLWNDLPIPLELNHKNGINTDHRIVNLEILCPNCHAQTDNYRGRNTKKI